MQKNFSVMCWCNLVGRKVCSCVGLFFIPFVRKSVNVLQRGRAIDTGEVDIGTQVMQTIPPGLFWRFQVITEHALYLKFNVSLAKDALLGIYGRRNLPPTHTQFDFVKLLDGKQLIKQENKPPDKSKHTPRNLILMALQEAGFVEYMDPGTWHFAFYNDGKKMEQVFVLTSVI
eukprot:g45809.t1